MAISKKVKIIVLAIIISLLLFTFVEALFVYMFYLIDKSHNALRDEIASVFEKYEKDERVATITRHTVDYKDYYLSFYNRIDDNNQMIVYYDRVCFIEICKKGLLSYGMYVYSHYFIDNSEVLLYEEHEMRTEPYVKVFDKKFYIFYKNAHRDEIICVFDTETSDYYLYSCNEQYTLSDVISREQEKKYQLELKISDDKDAFLIRNISVDSTMVLDRTFMRDSFFKDEMDTLDYKPSEIYISNNHIILQCLIGRRGTYVSSIILEYSPSTQELSFICFNKIRPSHTRYEYVE